MNNTHLPVLLREIIDKIDFNVCNLFLDGTYGAGGQQMKFYQKGVVCLHSITIKNQKQ